MVERRVRGVRSLASTSSKGFIHSFSIGSSAWVCRTGITLSFRSERRVLCRSPVCHSIVNFETEQAATSGTCFAAGLYQSAKADESLKAARNPVTIALHIRDNDRG